jgi:hypothetical protein
MSSTYLSTPANTSFWLIGNSGVSPEAITEVLGPDAPPAFFEMSSTDLVSLADVGMQVFLFFQD